MSKNIERKPWISRSKRAALAKEKPNAFVGWTDEEGRIHIAGSQLGIFFVPREVSDETLAIFGDVSADFLFFNPDFFEHPRDSYQIPLLQGFFELLEDPELSQTKEVLLNALERKDFPTVVQLRSGGMIKRCLETLLNELMSRDRMVQFPNGDCKVSKPILLGQSDELKKNLAFWAGKERKLFFNAAEN